jgi:hypothetical protein
VSGWVGGVGGTAHSVQGSDEAKRSFGVRKERFMGKVEHLQVRAATQHCKYGRFLGRGGEGGAHKIGVAEQHLQPNHS